MDIVVDSKAIWLVLLFLTGFFLAHRYGKQGDVPPSFFFSNLQDLLLPFQVGRQRFVRYPSFFKNLALISWLLAFLDFHLEHPLSAPEIAKVRNPSQKLATEGIALYLVLDRSGSMAVQMADIEGGKQARFRSKMDILKEVTRDFIEGNPDSGLSGRSQDLIGIIAFARAPEVIAPLTLDHDALLNSLAKLEVIKDKSQDGTAIGYAIYKTASIIAATKKFAKKIEEVGKPAYDIKSTAIVLITDGFQSPHPDDRENSLRSMGIEEAANDAKNEGIHLYMVTIDPAIDQEEFAPQRRLMTHASEITGGRYFAITEPSQLTKIYKEINQLEKTIIPDDAAFQPLSQKKGAQSFSYRTASFFPYLIGLGLFFLFWGIFLETTLLRIVP